MNAVFRVPGGDVARPGEKKGAGIVLAFTYHNRRKRRRAAVSCSTWRAPGAPGSGEQREQQLVGSDRHLGSRASGAGCPFLIRAERKLVRTGGGDGSSEARWYSQSAIARFASRGLNLFWAASWPSGSCQFPVARFCVLARALEAVGVVGKRPETEDAGNKGRQTCQTELALTCKLWAPGIQSSILSNPVQSRPGPSNQAALAVEALQVGQEPGTGRGGGQTAAPKSGRLHSDSRVAPGSTLGRLHAVGLFVLFEVEEPPCRPLLVLKGRTVVGSTAWVPRSGNKKKHEVVYAMRCKRAAACQCIPDPRHAGSSGAEQCQF